jgi:hypothetical protein
MPARQNLPWCRMELPSVFNACRVVSRLQPEGVTATTGDLNHDDQQHFRRALERLGLRSAGILALRQRRRQHGRG